MKTILSAAVLSSLIAVGCSNDEVGEHYDHRHPDRVQSKSTDIDKKDVPDVVMRGFEKAYPGAKIREVEKELYTDGTVHYEFEYKNADGKNKEVELNDQGEVLEGHK